jgi:hypothetical protein
LWWQNCNENANTNGFVPFNGWFFLIFIQFFKINFFCLGLLQHKSNMAADEQILPEWLAWTGMMMLFFENR